MTHRSSSSFATCLLTCLLLAPTAVRADETIVLRSGVNPAHFLTGAAGRPLRNDPFSEADFAAARTGDAAFTITRNSAWIPQLECDPESLWINSMPTTRPQTVLYAVDFEVTTTPIAAASIDFCWATDDQLGDSLLGPGVGANQVGVFLNGAPLPEEFLLGGFTEESTASLDGIEDLLVTGTNTLYVYQRDRFFIASGVMFSATLSVSGGSCDADGFEGGADAAGEADVVFPGAGFTVVGSPGPAILFDSDAPGCDDADLTTPGPGPGNDLAQGQVLILREMDSDCVRDDDRNGGTLTFTWDVPVDFASVGVLDVDEEGGFVTTLDADGAVLCVEPLPASDDNGWQDVACPSAGVTTMEVTLVGSGAVTGITCAPALAAAGELAGLGGRGTLAGGAELDVDVTAFGAAMAWGRLDYRAPLEAALELPTRSSRRQLEGVGVVRGTSRRGPTLAEPEHHRLVAMLDSVLVSPRTPGLLVLRGHGAWNGRGLHRVELTLDERRLDRGDVVELVVRAPDGAVVHRQAGALVEGDVVVERD
ncbi:MAG: hypothetical protein AAF533_07435 [Acidobacteriota bacterium]